MPSRKAGSIFLASAWVAALSSTAESAVKSCTKIGTETLYMEMVMERGPWSEGAWAGRASLARSRLGDCPNCHGRACSGHLDQDCPVLCLSRSPEQVRR